MPVPTARPRTGAVTCAIRALLPPRVPVRVVLLHATDFERIAVNMPQLTDTTVKPASHVRVDCERFMNGARHRAAYRVRRSAAKAEERPRAAGVKARLVRPVGKRSACV